MISQTYVFRDPVIQNRALWEFDLLNGETESEGYQCKQKEDVG